MVADTFVVEVPPELMGAPARGDAATGQSGYPASITKRRAELAKRLRDLSKPSIGQGVTTIGSPMRERVTR